MMWQDQYGLEVSCASAAELQSINHFIHGFLSYEDKEVNIIPAADQAPECCVLNAYAGMLWMFLEAPEAAEKARIYIDRALTASAGATSREADVVAAVAAWAAGDLSRAIGLCEQVVHAHPRDLVMVKLGQYLMFNKGDSAGMLRLGLRALPAADDIAYAHGMVAFGYEQCHLLDKAEAAARRAMQIMRAEPWAQHALAHVMLTQGRIEEGIGFLESVRDTWAGLNSFMYTHNWWHLALFYLSRGRAQDVLAIYDRHIWGIAKEYSQNQIGAVSLLARMELADVDVGGRWQDVADHVANRGADTVNPFLTMQYVLALGRAERDAAQDLLAAVEARAQDQGQEDHAIWADVALPACRGLLAFCQGDWGRCLKDLGQALPRMAEAGGSHAQRDLFEQIHLAALLHAGQDSRAQQVLEMRRTFDPDGVPLNQTLAAVYQRLGLQDLAKEAAIRAAGGAG